ASLAPSFSFSPALSAASLVFSAASPAPCLISEPRDFAAGVSATCLAALPTSEPTAFRSWAVLSWVGLEQPATARRTPTEMAVIRVRIASSFGVSPGTAKLVGGSLRRARRLNPPAMRIAFLGTPDFARSALERLVDSGQAVACVYSQPPAPRGRGHELKPS